MKALTVKQLAAISGVTVRTLHHYDEIGLLKPACTGANGYRYYERPQMLRLQQILFHREFGASLKEIAELLELEAGDQAAILIRHRERLEAQAERYRRLIETIDRTLADISGPETMSNADLYRGFSPEKQAGYEAWLTERYGGDMPDRIARSHQAWAELDEDGRQARMDDLRDLEAALAEGCRRGISPDAASIDPLLARHRAWVASMWDRPCPPEAYSGLADMYLAHPEFRARFETLQPGFTDWLAAAMKAHAAKG